MPVRKTESRIPAGFAADDLGAHATSSTSPAVILVAHLSSPVALTRIQRYTVFVTDPAIAATVDNYAWAIVNGTTHAETTTKGILEYTPQNAGTLSATVTLRNAANAPLFAVTLNQSVIALNAALELQIDQDENNFPGAGHPETSREIINDIRPYVNNLLPIATHEVFNKSVSALAYTYILQTPGVRNHFLLEELAEILNSNHVSFYGSAKEGIGICKTRPQLLAMCLQDPAAAAGTNYLSIATLEQAARANSTARTANATAIETAFNALSEDKKIDLYNLLRFPKSHVAMCKLIIEKLHDRYYNAATLATTLAAVNDARKILTEYEKGPIALGSGSSALSPTRLSRTIFTLTNHAVWNIPVAALSTGAAPPLGDGTGTAVAATVGMPEKLPSLTYIAHYDTEIGFSAGSLGFLRNAFLYHEGFNLQPQLIRSMEALIDVLSSAVTPIERLRIVTHFGTTTGVTDLTGNGLMFLPFFAGQTRNDGTSTISNHTRSQHFMFGVSDDAGIVGQFERDFLPTLLPDFLSSKTMTKQGETTARSYHDSIFRFLQASNHASLVPFGLETSGTPSTAVRTIMKWAGNLYFLNNLTVNISAAHPTAMAARAIPVALKNRLIAFVNENLTALATPTGPTTQANISALAAAFSSQTPATLQVDPPQSIVSVTYSLSSVYMQNHDVFRTKLQTVKNRLNNAFVDVRGCRVGQDSVFLEGLRSFFGNAGQEPTVSGPEWFQNIGNMGYATTTLESGMDTYFTSGIPGTAISGIDVQREYSAWAGRVGINSQMSFWITLFNGSAYDLVSLAWRVNLPPIGMHSKKLIDLQTANYAAAINLIKEIFAIPATTAPTAAICQTFETSFFPGIAGITVVEQAIIPLTDASPQPELQAQRTALVTVATALSATLPAAPVSITKAHLQDCIAILKTSVETHSGIAPLVTAIKAKLQDSKAGFRYMLNLGLPLLLQAASNEGDNRILYYPDQVVNALQAFQRIQFEGPLPAALTALIDGRTPVASDAAVVPHDATDPNDDTYTDLGHGLAFTGLSFDRNSTQSAITPSPEYFAHIITEPA